MPWPSIADFTASVQTPDKFFEDPELAGGRAERHPVRGTPLVYSGNFAAVYPVETVGGRKYAVRCFTREVNDQRERYGHLDAYLRGVRPDAFVTFEYKDRGIKIRGDWFPIVKMAWVEGKRLDRFVEDNLSRPNLILDVCARWRGANGSLRGLNIAHNDLQHGNIMVMDDGSLRLVDYDGIFLPQFQGQLSPELGHAQFQHPQRNVNDYGDYVDNFPALVLYLSLLALSVDPSLWQRFYTQENLILSKSDYTDTANSECFRVLRNSPHPTVRYLADCLERYCSMPVDQIPELEDILNGAPVTSPGGAPPSPFRSGTQAQTASPTPPPRTAGAGAQTSPSPGASPRVVGGGSAYRRLLQMGPSSRTAPGGAASAQPAAAPGQAAAPPPQPAQAVTPTMPCPQCNRANALDLVYCDDESCATPLYPGNRVCIHCLDSIPVNGDFCPECGARLI